MRLLILSILLIAAWAPQCSAQSLTITSGIHVVASGQPQIVLSDLSLVNNGAFFADTSTVIFTGGNSILPTISGTGNLDFFRLTVNKAAGNVQVQRNITAADTVKIIQGNLQLFATSLDLGTSGQLSGERDGNYVVGLDQGLVRASSVGVLAGMDASPGNLGLTVRPTTANMGTMTVERTNTMASFGNGVNSIRRIYHVSADYDQDLGARVVFHYFPSELADPNIGPSLFLYTAAQYGGPWTKAGRDTSDPAGLLLIKSGLDTLNELTLADTLPNLVRTGTVVLHVSPDPTTGVFSLTIINGLSAVHTIEILSQSGRVISTQSVLVKAGNRTVVPMNISAQPAGYYYIVFDNGPFEQAILFEKL